MPRRVGTAAPCMLTFSQELARKNEEGGGNTSKKWGIEAKEYAVSEKRGLLNRGAA